MRNADVVRRFEDEFKNGSYFDVVDELMSEDFVHHLPYPDLPGGRAGMKAVGELVTSLIHDIRVEVPVVISEGEFVADRVHATGVRAETKEPIAWVENHIYKVSNGRITELWPAGGPQL